LAHHDGIVGCRSPAVEKMQNTVRHGLGRGLVAAKNGGIGEKVGDANLFQGQLMAKIGEIVEDKTHSVRKTNVCGAVCEKKKKEEKTNKQKKERETKWH
jgi:hypothetical protein